MRCFMSFWAIIIYSVLGCGEKSLEPAFTANPNPTTDSIDISTGEVGSFRIAIRIPKIVAVNVARVEFVITAADMDTIKGDLTIGDDDVARGTARNIPAGSDRLVTLNAYNAEEVMSYSGSAATDVVAGGVVSVNIVMRSLLPTTGDVEINGTFESAGDSSPILGIMAGAPLVQEVILEGAVVDIEGILNNQDLSATQHGEFAVYERSLSSMWSEAPKEVTLIFAINSLGEFYVGAIGESPAVLSVLSVPIWHFRGPQIYGFVELKNHSTSLFHALLVEYHRLAANSLISGGAPLVNLSNGYELRRSTLASWYELETRLYNSLSQSVFIIYSAVSVNDPSTYSNMAPWYIEINNHWWPYSSGSTGSSALRSLSVQYSNPRNSYIVGFVGNDNGNSATLSLDDGSVISSNSSSTAKQFLRDGIYPEEIELSATRTWSVTLSSLSIVVIADNVDITSFSVEPDESPVLNPPPLVRKLEIGWIED
jgi:hypothetical protein